MKQELAIQNQVGDAELVGYLDNLGLTKRLSDGEKNTYLQIAKAFGLNPFKREIHVSKYGDNMSIITGYEVYIKRAERTGQLDGWNATTTGSVATGDLKATVTIYRKDRTHPFVWEALYDECVQKTRDGKVTQFWTKAAFMTKKVAISQGFRLCFSDELAGMPYTADEMPAEAQTVDVVHTDITPQAEPEVTLPYITAKMFGQLLERLKGGDTEVIKKAAEKFLFTEEQLEQVQAVESEIYETGEVA